jgi:signal transduction histidine kinase
MRKLQERLYEKLSEYSPRRVVLASTVVASLLSIPTVYLLFALFGESYTLFVFCITLAMPVLIAPVIVFLILRIVKHLNYYKKYLELEIEKSKQKDMVLFEQARFAVMGEMLANISHQWKQPLNTVGLAIVSLRTSQNEEGRERYYDIMEDNINYLATTIDDFSSFFDQRTHLEIRSIEDILKEIRSIVGVYMDNKNIDLDVKIENALGEVKLASSIAQVLLNLINNAKDAFEREQNKKEIHLAFETLQNGLRILCCDNGKGIPPEIQTKIYDPYFTTKSKKRGSGIGLYMSRQIIQKLFDGTIELQKNPRYATCFAVEIPFSQNCVLQKKGR